MMDLDAIAVFVKVVQAGSFSRAAKLLAMPNTTVSAKVAALERRLGVTLIQRTTRKLHVTQAGQAYYRKCAAALDGIYAAESEIGVARGEPKGLLRITASADMGHILLPGLVTQYLRRYPQMSVDLVVTNRVTDLVAEGIDIALRAGQLKDSSLVARKLIAANLVLWATPAYLKKCGPVAHPRDVSRLECVRFSVLQTRVELANGRERAKVELGGRISADDPETIKALILGGEGLGLLPDLLCKREESRGDLVRVLPDWHVPGSQLSLVYPAQPFVSPQVRAFVALAEERLCAHSGGGNPLP